MLFNAYCTHPPLERKAAGIPTAATLMSGGILSLRAYKPSPSSRFDNTDGSGAASELQESDDDADDSYAYASEYGYSDDAYDEAQASSTEAAVLYFSAQTLSIQLSVALAGSSSSESVSIATDPIPSHGYVYGDGFKLRVIGFSDNLGRECRDGVIVGAEDDCVSVPSDTCTDAECCRGLVCTVMPSGPDRCRIAEVPGLGFTPTRPVGILEPTSEPDASTIEEQPSNPSVIVGITLAIAALVVLLGIIAVRTYKNNDDSYGDATNGNKKVVLTLDDDCTTVYASESGWESSHFTSRQQSRLESGRSSTGYSTYSNNMPMNPPQSRRTKSRPDDFVRQNKFQWQHSSHGDVV